MEEVGEGCLWVVVETGGHLYEWLPWPLKWLVLILGAGLLLSAVVSVALFVMGA